MLNGVVIATEEGTPQGGPLSPLLANIMLDDLDKLLEQRGLSILLATRTTATSMFSANVRENG